MSVREKHKLGDLFENTHGNKLIYIGTKALPVLHNKKSFDFLKKRDFSIKDGKHFARFSVADTSIFLPVGIVSGVQFIYTGSSSFKFLNLSKLIKTKKHFNSLKLGLFEEENRNLKGINDLDVAWGNFTQFNYYGFPDLALGTNYVDVPLENLVHHPLIENNSCGPCEKYYPCTQKLFNFMQMYERLIDVETIEGVFVNKNARLVSFLITQTSKLKFKFEFKEVGSEKCLTIHSQTLFDLRQWYRSIPFDDKNVDFICIAGCTCPSGSFSWGLMDIEVKHKN